jgi:UDP-glucuronate 4-epimerase
MNILVTGAAGFIGYHLARWLAERGDQVVGLDDINEYYDVRVKHGRLRELGIDVAKAEWGKVVQSDRYPSMRFVRMNIENAANLRALFDERGFQRVCHLAAQAGVRYSLINPAVYATTNVQGFLNVLEAARANKVDHLVYASSSSVYGLNTLMPFSESGPADHPASLYAASKRSNELMAHSYSHIYKLPTTGLRFFTVYGPWGRPDMALFIFTKAMQEGREIEVFNCGNMRRDFTYVDDIIEGVIRVIDRPPSGEPAWDGRESSVSPAPYKLYNIGNGAPVGLMDFVRALENELGIQAKTKLLPLQPGDVAATWADCSALERDTGYRPRTDVTDGIRKFVQWYREFYGAGSDGLEPSGTAQEQEH